MRALLLLLLLLTAGLMDNVARGAVDREAKSLIPASASLWHGVVGPSVPRIFLGYEGTVASLMWIAAVTEAADNLKQSDDRSMLGSILAQVVHLDSLWEYPHIFGGLLLDAPNGDPFPEALDLLEAACRRFPNQWRTRVLYSQRLQRAHWLEDSIRSDSAYRVLMTLTNRPDVPPFVRTLAFTVRMKEGDTAEAIGALLMAWRLSDDPLSGSVFREKLRKILVGLAPHDSGVITRALAGLEQVVLANEDTELLLMQFAVQIRDPAQRSRTLRILSTIGLEAVSPG